MLTRRAVPTAGRPRPSPAAGPGSFVVHVDLGTGRLTAGGRLDAGTAHLLRAGISALLRSDQQVWTVDVTDVEVADHAGLRVIAGSYRRAVEHRRRMSLEGASPALRHALNRLRLDRHVLPGE
ncbi:STAS domain-containing protein [Blastococcus sp. URHD0036]|uniref:STAS domain-containing protein n=1 Tax=Blastococcus sp. URHD0036 TaxID=1380356 RepID=UPI0004983F2A|nr:STAS domain-containing protein [Blastococcus sp. URHD0036]